MRPAVILLKLLERQVVGVEEAELLKLGTQQQAYGAADAGAVGQAGYEAVFQETELGVEVEVEGHVHHLAHHQRRLKGEAVVKLKLVAYVKDEELEESPLRVARLDIGDLRHNEVGERQPDKSVVLERGVQAQRSVEDALSAVERLDELVAGLIIGIGQGRVVQPEVGELRREARSHLHILSYIITEGIIELEAQAGHRSDILPKHVEAHAQRPADRAMVVEPVGQRRAGKTGPLVAEVALQDVRLFKARIGGIDEDGRNEVVVENGGVLRTERLKAAEYEDEDYNSFHDLAVFGC